MKFNEIPKEDWFSFVAELFSCKVNSIEIEDNSVTANVTTEWFDGTETFVIDDEIGFNIPFASESDMIENDWSSSDGTDVDKYIRFLLEHEINPLEYLIEE